MVKDGGGEDGLCRCAHMGGVDIPLGSGWKASSTWMVLWGPLSGIISPTCLATKGSSLARCNSLPYPVCTIEVFRKDLHEHCKGPISPPSPTVPGNPFLPKPLLRRGVKEPEECFIWGGMTAGHLELAWSWHFGQL